MPVPAATSPARPTSQRRRIPTLIGAAFIGSTLIATIAPAYAAPSPVTLSFTQNLSQISPGESLRPNVLMLSNQGDLTICLVSLELDADAYSVETFIEGAPIAPGSGPLPVGVVTGGTPQDDDTVTATLTYALAEEGALCDDTSGTGSASATWTIEVTEPEPSPTPTPTEEPTESPSPTPDPSPTPTPSPTRTPEPTTTPTDPSTSPERPSPTEAPGTDGPSNTPSNTPTTSPERDSSNRGSSGSASPDRGSPDRTPPQGDVPTNGASIPDLPRGEADLPDLAPGSPEDLADLPLVTPTSADDDEDTETEIAADHNELGPSVTPAILLAAFLLALLLAAPLAPTRRVRLGLNGYQGKRRRG